MAFLTMRFGMVVRLLFLIAEKNDVGSGTSCHGSTGQQTRSRAQLCEASLKELQSSPSLPTKQPFHAGTGICTCT